MNLIFSVIRQASINYINQSSTVKERADRVARTRVILDYIHHRQLRQTLNRNGGFWGKNIPEYVDPVYSAASLLGRLDRPDLQVQRLCADTTTTKLPENTVLCSQACTYCDAKPGDTHARVCPHGERYKQAQELRDAAVVLGKLGGKVKSPSKTASSQANGEKGGRPKKQSSQLDMEDI